MEYLLYGVVLLGAFAGAFLFFRSPTAYIGLGKAILSALLPSIIKAVAPKDLTEEQREKIRMGQDPFRKRQKGE